MKISVFYHHIQEAAKQNSISEEEVLQTVKSLGIDFCELDFSEIENSDIILNKLAKSSINVSSVYCFYDFNKRDENQKIKNHVARTKDSGSKNLMIIPGFYSEKQNEAEEKLFIQGTSDVCNLANQKNICPLIEDFDDCKSPIATMNQMKKFADQIPNLRIAFDTGNFMYSCESELQAFDLLENKISHVHCKDRSLKTKTNCEEKLCIDGKKMFPAAVGCGNIKMEEIIKRLLKKNYQGIFTIEHFGAENQLEYIKKSVEFLKSFSK